MNAAEERARLLDRKPDALHACDAETFLLEVREDRPCSARRDAVRFENRECSFSHVRSREVRTEN